MAVAEFALLDDAGVGADFECGLRAAAKAEEEMELALAGRGRGADRVGSRRRPGWRRRRRAWTRWTPPRRLAPTPHPHLRATPAGTDCAPFLRSAAEDHTASLCASLWIAAQNEVRLRQLGSRQLSQGNVSRFALHHCFPPIYHTEPLMLGACKTRLVSRAVDKAGKRRQRTGRNW